MMGAGALAGRVHRQWTRWMYRSGRPNRMASAMNRCWEVVATVGIWPERLATLEVRGRRTGRLVRVPVVITDYCGNRYLVSMLGQRAAWVLNVRATGGNAVLHHGQYEAVHLHEIDVAHRGPILRRYLQLAPGARAHLPVDRHASLVEFDAIAAQFPVFRIEPARPHVS